MRWSGKRAIRRRICPAVISPIPRKSFSGPANQKRSPIVITMKPCEPLPVANKCAMCGSSRPLRHGRRSVASSIQRKSRFLYLRESSWLALGPVIGCLTHSVGAVQRALPQRCLGGGFWELTWRRTFCGWRGVVVKRWMNLGSGRKRFVSCRDLSKLPLWPRVLRQMMGFAWRNLTWTFLFDLPSGLGNA